MPMTDDRRERLRKHLLENGEGVAAYWKLIEQLEIVSKRIHEQAPEFLRVFRAPGEESYPGEVFRKGAALRLDLEVYFDVANRLFRLCAAITGRHELLEEPLVANIRKVRNRIVEHGYELEREGSRSFICDDNGPRLVSATGETTCPPFFELEGSVVEILKKHGLTRSAFMSRFLPRWS
jgi:hypothetical protein